MERKSKKFLRLFEAIQERPKQSQRELAGTLDLSLGMVNKLINELCSQDYLRTEKCGKNRVQYILTCKGTERNKDLKRQKLKNQLDAYKEMKKVVGQGLTQLKDLPNNCCILFYGAGELCEIACLFSGQISTSCEIKIIDDLKAGKSINGYKIYKEAEMENMTYDAILIMELENACQVSSELVDRGISKGKIFQIISQDSILLL